MTHSDAVLTALRRYRKGLSDYGLFHAVKALRPDTRPTPSSVRTRRAELVKAGMVTDSGRSEVSSTGRKARVWTLA